MINNNSINNSNIIDVTPEDSYISTDITEETKTREAKKVIVRVDARVVDENGEELIKILFSDNKSTDLSLYKEVVHNLAGIDDMLTKIAIYKLKDRNANM